MRVFAKNYSADCGELCAPELMLGVWLYAYTPGATSARQLESRLVREEYLCPYVYQEDIKLRVILVVTKDHSPFGL